SAAPLPQSLNPCARPSLPPSVSARGSGLHRNEVRDGGEGRERDLRYRPAQPQRSGGQKLRPRSRGEREGREDLEMIDGAADMERQLQQEEGGREKPCAPERRPEKPGNRERDQSPTRRQLRDNLQSPENDLRKAGPGVSLARFEEPIVQTTQVRGEAALD